MGDQRPEVLSPCRCLLHSFIRRISAFGLRDASWAGAFYPPFPSHNHDVFKRGVLSLDISYFCDS